MEILNKRITRPSSRLVTYHLLGSLCEPTCLYFVRQFARPGLPLALEGRTKISAMDSVVSTPCESDRPISWKHV